MPITPASSDDLSALEDQLGREPRGVAGVAWRCPCGRPGVAATAPRLPDGTPFPTTYYLTCPNAVAACSRLESSGVMASMTARLADDAELRAAYEAAHRAYLRDRAALAASLGVDDVPKTDDSAGGMPSRVKCLHALVGHALATGPGVNPFGDEALAAIGEFWREPCLESQGTASPDPVESEAPIPRHPARSEAKSQDLPERSKDPGQTNRVGVIDCGTNTVRLLIADDAAASGQVGHDPYLADLVRVLRFVRLGQGVDATHRFHPDALVRTFAALDEFAALIEQFGPLDGLRFLATSAARDATNRAEFFAGVEARVGVTPDVITGEEEARLSFLGALAGGSVETSSCAQRSAVAGSAEAKQEAGPDPATDAQDDETRDRAHNDKAAFSSSSCAERASARGVAGSAERSKDTGQILRLRSATRSMTGILVMDIGGGSTELILGDAEGAVTAAQSFDVGSVRLRERFLHDDPPTAAQIAEARGYVASLIDGGAVPLDGIDTFIGVAGTNTSLSAMRQGMVTYDSTRVHNSSLTAGEISALTGELLAAPVSEVRERYPFLEPMRAEVICAGALICDEVANRVQTAMLVRETDILDGAALDLLRRSPKLP